jgi:hypothetical protein
MPARILEIHNRSAFKTISPDDYQKFKDYCLQILIITEPHSEMSFAELLEIRDKVAENIALSYEDFNSFLAACEFYIEDNLQSCNEADIERKLDIWNFKENYEKDEEEKPINLVQNPSDKRRNSSMGEDLNPRLQR